MKGKARASENKLTEATTGDGMGLRGCGQWCRGSIGKDGSVGLRSVASWIERKRRGVTVTLRDRARWSA